MREREAKLIVSDSFELPDLSDSITGAVLGEAVEWVADDVYHDTADLRLARWGCTIRHRDGEGWTVKIPKPSAGLVLDRIEVGFRGERDAPPTRALNLVGSLTRGADVGEVAHLRTRRIRRDVTLPDGERVGELTDDVVWGRARDGAESRFREIEVELAEHADERWWSEILERLGDTRPVAEQPIPKAVRVLGPAAIEPPDVVVPTLRSKPTAHEVVQAALASSVAQLLLQLPGARLGTDPEGVHQARVAARRMNSDLKTFKPLLAGDWAGGLRGELRWMIDALGAVRDCDVLAMKLGEVAARHPEIDPDAAERVLHEVDLQRRASRRRLLRCLGDDRAIRLFDELVAVAASPTTRRRAERPAHEVMPKLVRKHWNRLERAIDALDRHPTPSELHAVRILAKRLRYATEAVVPAAGKPARKFAKQAARIQDALGDLNDAAVAREWLTATAGHLDGPAGFAAGQLAQTLVAEAHTNDQAWRSAHLSMTRHTAWFL